MYGVVRSIFECIREREFNGRLPSDCFAALAAIREEVEDEKMSPTTIHLQISPKANPDLRKTLSQYEATQAAHRTQWMQSVC